MINPEPSAPVDDETAGSGGKKGVCVRKKKQARQKDKWPSQPVGAPESLISCPLGFLRTRL